MVNNGSERETEAILHEFAEALDDRALLLSTGETSVRWRRSISACRAHRRRWRWSPILLSG